MASDEKCQEKRIKVGHYYESKMDVDVRNMSRFSFERFVVQSCWI